MRIHLVSIFLPVLLFAQTNNLDGYGGFLPKNFDDGEGNGFFRTKYDQGRWWLVTPEDNAFLSFGLNHLHAGLWAKDYNKTYWEGVFGGNAYTNTWRDGLYKFALDIFESINANTFGYHNEGATLEDRPRVLPYIRQYKPLNLSIHLRPTSEDFVDVFAPAFRQTCADAAQEQVLPHINDKMIIGFAMSDVPVLTELHARNTSNWISGYDSPTWPLVLRNLPSSSTGKQRYVDTMKDIYNNNITAFNATYNTNFETWLELTNAENWRPNTDYDNANEVADNNEYGKLCINKYYEVASQAFRAVNQNHLFLGDKINANSRDRDELKLIINEIKDYVDVILFQSYGRSDFQQILHDDITEIANLPIINGDGGFGSADDPTNMPNPQTPTAQDQKQRGDWFKEYTENAFANPNFVGFYICGIIDQWTSGKQKPGIINPLGVEHTDVIEALADIGNNLYQYGGLSSDTIEDDYQIISVYPNPVKDVLQISNFQTISDTHLYDTSGREIYIKYEHDGQLNLTNIRNGAYILKCKLLDGGDVSRKIFVNKSR